MTAPDASSVPCQHPLGSAFYAVRSGNLLTLYRRSDRSWAGETGISRRSSDDLRRLADEIDGGRML